jgi:branched-chain amino acid transport system substrate-binding protein
MKRILTASLFGLSLATSGLAHAEPVKIGVITTLSGGGAGLGIDMRDAFQLAIKQSGNKDI